MSDLPVFTTADLESAPAFDVASFTNEDGVDLGLIAVDLIRERGLSLTVRVGLRGDQVFLARLGTTGPGNDVWMAGKVLVVEEHGVPSLLVRRRMEDAGEWDQDAVMNGEKKPVGGSIPIRVAGELVGTITLSGQADVVDHEVGAEAVRRYLAR
jgi:uncharacterized protein (UPF0303 family)